ncbi:MAG: hypothetical protein A2381_17265 [Bdellovibrionales bacterium RIFOXYB1_FULL_37_110]|nr:MAG: hypothetical protein A2181_08270 [Bdellovibrionales bacterium RIFOXYA1_FULL_38_20]OFZ50145.1 MAG: hypothetical protein A2417_19100 [Bdellovibrionales bacterium RIFOXYC1_FULL_37_79]OFZ60051.1 MAG: hypothetical protein A2381_17265 [Bdellovibrionales bacterium RIFOXYB1_FULL_37_110]OFZ62675.1 MAG: hypothetical protein A2577_16260 [Bdellovibrionales bacterium RIFOXYD1_FULL_36_51]
MKNIIQSFDNYLFKNKLKFDAVVIGGAALIIMDVVSRKTRDIDCLDPEISEQIKKASQQYAKEFPEFRLDENWLNNGPVDLKRNLLSDWRFRLQEIFTGKAINLKTLGRSDLLKSKLFACADRDFDFEDCISLAPTGNELDECYLWVCEQDLNPLWPKHVETVFNKIRKRLGYES